MKFDPKDWHCSTVGKNLLCDYTKKACFIKRKHCIKDCKKLLDEYYVYQENIAPLTEFAEQDFCKRCKVENCKVFSEGDFINCMKVVIAFMDGEDA